MRLFQYIFYRIERIYKKWEEFGSDVSAVALLSCCQMFNVLSVLPLIMAIKMNNWLVVIIGLLLMIFNGCYFLSNKRAAFDDRWKNEKMSKRRIRGILIIAYIIGSVILYICSFRWYTGYSNWEWEF